MTACGTFSILERRQGAFQCLLSSFSVGDSEPRFYLTKFLWKPSASKRRNEVVIVSSLEQAAMTPTSLRNFSTPGMAWCAESWLEYKSEAILLTITSGFSDTTRSTNAIVSGEVDQLVPVQVGLSQSPRRLGNFDSARALPGATDMHGGTEPSLADKLRHVCLPYCSKSR